MTAAPVAGGAVRAPAHLLPRRWLVQRGGLAARRLDLGVAQHVLHPEAGAARPPATRAVLGREQLADGLYRQRVQQLLEVSEAPARALLASETVPRPAPPLPTSGVGAW